MGMTVPEEYGGTNMGYLAHIIALEEISRASASVGLLLRRPLQPVRQPDPPQRQRSPEEEIPAQADLRRARRRAGDEPEPNAGSDVVDEAAGRKKGDRYVLNGAKMWITNGGDADTLVVYAKTDPDAGARGMTAFIVEKGMKGFFHGNHLDKLGMRGSNTYPLFFDDCEVPEENVLGGVGNGTKVLMSGLDYERAVLCGGPLGIMAGVHGHRGALPPRAQTVRPEHRRVPADAGQARRHVHAPGTPAAPMFAVGTGLRPHRPRPHPCAGTPPAPSSIPPRRPPGWPAGDPDPRRQRLHQRLPTGRLWRDAKLYEIGAGTSEIRRMPIGRELFGGDGLSQAPGRAAVAGRFRWAISRRRCRVLPPGSRWPGGGWCPGETDS